MIYKTRQIDCAKNQRIAGKDILKLNYFTCQHNFTLEIFSFIVFFSEVMRGNKNKIYV